MSDQIEQPKPIWLRLKDSDREYISALAEDEGRSVASMLQRIVVRYIEEQRKANAKKVTK